MNVIKTLPNKTSTDLTGKEGYAVKFDTDGNVVCSAITDRAVGIVVRGGATESDICIMGECIALAGGIVTRGKPVIPHTDGTVKDTAASSKELGLALESGIARNQLIQMEHGRRGVLIERVYDLAEALGVSVSEIVVDDPAEPRHR